MYFENPRLDKAKKFLREKVLRLPPVPAFLPIRALPNKPGEYSWDDWREDLEAKYPIRYWLTESMPFWISVNVLMPLKDVHYWVRTHTVNKYHLVDIRDPQNGYNWGWIDKDRGILFASFALLSAYIEKENALEFIDWEADETHSAAVKEIKALYYWWKNERPADHKKYDSMTGDYKSINEEENRLRLKDTEMLHRLINIRDFLWT